MSARCIAVVAAILLIINSAGEVHAKPSYAGLVMDAKTGKILYSRRANEYRYPASLTKMMTLYLMFEALEQGKLTKKTRIRMSKYAASKPPSKLGIKPGRTLSAEQAILALVTKSANDVAAAVAEHLGGSESNFAVRMTKRARQLGMSKTTFKNASGLTAKGQITTARDMAILGIALREHYPKYYRYFSTRLFKYGKRKYGNHNRLLGRVKGVDGIKTGYTRASGFNLVSSVEKNKRSIVAVVMGGKSGKSRNAQMQKLISRYLKKATRRTKKKMLVAAIDLPYTQANIQVAGFIKLPKRGPIPVFRSQVNDPARLRIEQAHIASTAFARDEANVSRNSINAIKSKLLAMNNQPTPQKAVRNKKNLDRITTASVEQETPVRQHPKKSTARIAPSNGGWQVQVGAVPDQESALKLLTRARSKMPSLENASRYGELHDYLEPIIKNGETLYRARLAGFKSKKSARNACKAMKRKKISCLALKG